MKNLMKWFLKWIIISNGVLCLTAFVIGQLIRLGVGKNTEVVEWLRFWNKWTVVVFDTWTGKKETSEEEDC